MTPPDRTQAEALAIERARSAATLAALHDDLDRAVAERDRLADEVEALRSARDHEVERAEAAEAEVRALRATRAVRWASRVRAVRGR
ncbi:MAG: hypothetical protein ACKOOG_04720 [Actinomycetota bacterium]